MKKKIVIAENGRKWKIEKMRSRAGSCTSC